MTSLNDPAQPEARAVRAGVRPPAHPHVTPIVISAGVNAP